MRVFIAINLSDTIQQSLGELQQSIRKAAGLVQGDAGWVRPEGTHLTLKFLGEIEKDKVKEITAVVAQVAEIHRAFDIDVKTVGTFGRPTKVLWVGVNDRENKLIALQKDLEEGMSRAGYPIEERQFSGHLTLCRVKLLKAAKRIDAVLDQFADTSLGTFKADSLCVYKSELTREGPVYTLLSKSKLQP
jgi:2'-5' RNA ligase